MNERPRPVNPRRRRRTPWENFKEAYLPAIIACAALLLILIFIIGSISRGIQHKKAEEYALLAAEKAAAAETARLNNEATLLLSQAAPLAEQYDYLGALEILDKFTGDRSEFQKLAEVYAQYQVAQQDMVLWNDPAKVVNLSFQLLIADPQRAFNDASYARAFNRNFITTTEFSKILQQLYENGYILVRYSDIIETTANADGSYSTTVKDLYLPNGKKPLIITQTNVNYNTYMVDGDGDRMPDKDGSGFANRLILDENGKLSCEIVNADGSTSTGTYDLVPILESFIATHPHFSYKGARAVLAVTGYDGVFGYRTNPGADDFFGTMVYTQEVEKAGKVAKALRDAGYEIACYTYNNEDYNALSAGQIEADIHKWLTEAAPIIGKTNILVFAQNSDIAPAKVTYSGEKLRVLAQAGFCNYLGFSTDGAGWFVATDGYTRQGRLMVTGANLAYNAQWFDGIFDAQSVLDRNSRGEVPAW